MFAPWQPYESWQRSANPLGKNTKVYQVPQLSPEEYLTPTLRCQAVLEPFWKPPVLFPKGDHPAPHPEEHRWMVGEFPRTSFEVDPHSTVLRALYYPLAGV